MSSYTKGPWGIEQADDTNWIGFMRPDGRKVELIVCTTDRYSITNEALERNDANARLIASAPDLLEALEGFVSCWDACGSPLEFVARARYAIAKATGESA